MEKVLQQILSKMTEIDSKMTRMESEIQDLKSSTNHRFDTIETKMALSEQRITTEISEMKQVVEKTNQDVQQILYNQKSIYEILGEHEVSLRTLRRKPV